MGTWGSVEKDKRLSHATNKWIEFLKEKLTEQK